MNKVALYGLGGAGTVLLLMAIVKKKKKSHPTMGTSQTGMAGPKVYTAVAGDRPTAIMARFGMGTNIAPWMAINGGKPIITSAGKSFNLPPGVADLGVRPQAMGSVK